MRSLAVLRHAKSSRDDRGLGDFHRPLSERGWQVAGELGKELAHRGIAFDLVVASPARRVRETIEALAQALRPDVPIRFEPALRLARLAELLGIVRGLADAAMRPFSLDIIPGFRTSFSR